MLQPELATATAEPCPAPACPPSVPSITALPPFRDKDALEMRQNLVQVDGEEMEGAERRWILVGTIICIQLCHPGLSVGIFHNCFYNSRLTFLREKKMTTE